MYAFIINPLSRSGKGLQIWHKLQPLIKQQKIEYTSHFTKHEGHATKIVADLSTNSKNGEELILIVLGGDGTINEVLNGIHHFDNLKIGYIPTGSSNDFARSHKLPTQPAKALHKILTSTHTKSLDIGQLTYADQSRKFMVSAGIGFDAAVCQYAAISKWKAFLNKIKLGKLTYVGIALARLLFSTPSTLSLTLDSTTTLRFENAYFAAIMNHPYEGGGLKFCPNAQPSDGVLDVVVAYQMSKLRVLGVLPLAFKGWHTRCKGVKTFTCKHVLIESELALPIHTDGEALCVQKTVTASLDGRRVGLIV